METFKSNALKCPEVLDMVKEFVDCPATLRSCKQLNKLWFGIFEKKASQTSTFNDLTNIVNQFMDGFGYIGPTKVPKVQRLKLAETIETLENDNVSRFFQLYGKNLKYLSMEEAENEETSIVHARFIYNVLFKWCLQLEELKIGMFPDENESSHHIRDEFNIPLKKLVANYRNLPLDCDTIQVSVIEKILERATKLESFVYFGYKSGRCYEDAINYNCIEMVRLIGNNCKNLTSLELFGGSVGANTVRGLSTAGLPLKKFVLEGLPKRDLKIHHLNSFIDAYANSLKHLHIKVHWFMCFVDSNLELKVDTITNLEVLKLSVEKIYVGKTGLLGNLNSLRHLTLWGNRIQYGFQQEIKTMFKEKISTSITSLSLHDFSIKSICVLREYCPNVTELEIMFQLRECKDFLPVFNSIVDGNKFLEDLRIHVLYPNWNDDNDWTIAMVGELLRYKLRTLKIVAQTDVIDNHYYPEIRKQWIQDGILSNENTFYCIELVGFNIREDELDGIAKLLFFKSNFAKLVDCNLTKLNGGGNMSIKRIDFFPDNVDLAIQNFQETFMTNNIMI